MQNFIKPVAIAFVLLCVQCSFLKLDKETNCLNDKTACFKEDKTRPSFVQTVLPAPGVVVSTLGEVQLLFSEELNNPQPSDFVYSEPGLTVQSVTKIDKFTYRLLNNRNPNQGGPLTLTFNGLKDYAGNTITNGSITYTINLNIPVTPTATHTGVSTAGYPTVSVSWYFAYTPVISGDTIYHVRLTTGAEDCSAGAPITPATATPLVNSAVLTYDETNTTTIAATTYNFTVNTTVITSSGAQKILICLNNVNNNKFGIGVINVVRDDTLPDVLAISPVGGNYVTPQTLRFTCSDNVDRIIYNYASNAAQAFDPVAGDVTEPVFNTSTGALVAGTGFIYDPDNKPVTPYSDNTTRSIYKYRCIDKAGNITPENAFAALVSGVYRINSTFPTVSLISLTKTGANPEVNISGVGAGGYTSATLRWSTNQVGQAWEIRSGGTDCGVGGTIVAQGSGGTATPSPANTPILTDILNTSPGIALGLNNLRVCVSNGSEWGQAGFTLLRDDSAPSTLTVNVPPADYGTVQNLVFSCSDNEDRVIFTESFSAPGVAPADPGDPLFDADGRRLVGTLHTGPHAVTSDDTSLIGKRTRIKYRCIDKAGHVTAVNDVTYTIDTLLPTITVQSQNHTAVSAQLGANGTLQLTWVADRQITGYDLRRGSTNCIDGTVLTSGTNLSSPSVLAAGTTVTSTINANLTNFALGEGSYTIHICTSNSIGSKGYTSRAVKYDTTPPAFAGLTSLTSGGIGNFTLHWSLADDTTGSGIAYYNIYRAESSTGPYPTVHHIATHPADSINVTVPVAATTYYYVAGAVDNAGNETKVTVLPLATAPTISVTMISELTSTNFTLSDGTVSAALTAATTTTTAAWSTTLGAGSTYNFSISNVPVGKICSIRQRQFGTLSSNITITIDCINGYTVAGRYQAMPAAPLNYMLYRGISSTTYSGATSINGVVTIGNMIYFVRREGTSNSSIQRCDPTNCAATLVTIVNQTPGVMRHLATDGTNLYAANPNGTAAAMRIYKYSALLTGQAVPQAEYNPGLTSGFHSGLALDANRNLLYVGLRGVAQIKRIHLDTGVVDTLSSVVSEHEGMALLGDDLYVATPDNGNCILKAINAHTATALALYAGACGATESFADGSLLNARFARAHGIVSDGTDLYIAEFAGARIRRIDVRKGFVSTIAGGGAAGTNGTGPVAGFANLFSMATDGRKLYASEGGSNRLRVIADFGLVAYWPLNSSTADYASSATTNYALSATGGFTTPPGRYNEDNGSHRFDGSNYLEVADQNQYDLSSEYTISVWIKRNAAGVMRIVDKATVNNCDGYNFDITSDNRLRLLYCIVNGVGQDVVSGNTVPVNQWVHVLATFSSSRQRARLYINGHLDAEKATGPGVSLTNALPLRLGADSTGLNQFSGAMADVRLYNRVLSEGEINELAQDASSNPVDTGASFNTGATGLLSHYEFNSGLDDQPTAPIGGTLTFSGTKTAVAGKDGDAAGAFFYDGASHNSGSGLGLPLGAAPRSVCSWFRLASQPGGNIRFPIVSYGTVGTYFDLVYFNAGSTSVPDYRLALSDTGSSIEAAAELPLNTWQHSCITHDGTTTRIYANGQQILSAADTLASITSANLLTIGKRTVSTARFHGAIDDVRIYNNALSAAQVRQLATQVRAGLVFRMDTAGDANDASGHNHVLVSNTGALAAGRHGVANTAYRFTSGQVATFAHSAAVMGKQDMTWSFWMKSPDMQTMDTAIIRKYTPVPSETGWVLKLNQIDNVHAWIAGGGPSVQSFPVLTNHVWNQYTIKREGLVMTVYLNGAVINGGNSNTANAILGNTQNVSVGSFATGELTLQDVRIYNRGLSQNEVRALAGYHVAQVDAGMRLHLQADNFSNLSQGTQISQNWQDSTPKTHYNASAQGVITNGGGIRFVTGSGNSLLGGKPAVEFDGTDGNHFDFGGGSSVTYSGLTVCAATTRKSNGYRGLIEKRAAIPASNSWAMLNDLPTNALKFEVDSTAPAEVVNAISNDTATIYCAVSEAGNLLRGYVNGQMTASTSKTTLSGSNSDSLIVGSRFLLSGSYYGQIGDIFMMEKDVLASERLVGECYLSSKYSIPLAAGVVCP